MRTKRSTQVVINCVLSIFAFIWLVPLIFALFTSFKSRQEYNLGNFWDFPQSNQLFENIDYVNRNADLLQGMFNSFIYAFLGALFAVIIAVAAAYAISHLKIKFRMFWFMFIYSGTVFPFQIYLIPIFRGFSDTGLYNTRLGMIIFYAAICIPFSMFVLRNFFLGISGEIMEQARIDGATTFQFFTRIMIPMATAPLSVVFLTQFNWSWNELMFGLTFTKSTEIRPIMATLSMMGENNVPALMLACLLASIPTLLFFSFLQKRFEAGFVYTSK